MPKSDEVALTKEFVEGLCEPPQAGVPLKDLKYPCRYLILDTTGGKEEWRCAYLNVERRALIDRQVRDAGAPVPIHCGGPPEFKRRR